ncbi:MAG TPA: 4-alpha-glucanotransferase [Longimicrobiaceae bacterium]|nr:4-alpha-glucanotransferase [Longimicrobiaceae bacterium]
MAEPLSTYPRSSGVLLHPTSLPGRGIGDLGEPARRFVDWLAEAGQGLWQILPLVPTNSGGSPYDGLSAMGGNPLLASPEALAADGLLDPAEIGGGELSADRVDFPRVAAWKDELLRRAWMALRGGAALHLRAEFDEFRARGASWLEDYALFRALREEYRCAAWSDWEPGLRRRDPEALARARRRLEGEVELNEFRQWVFDRQWKALREHAHARGVRIVGDVPIFVAYDSADVWAHPELFELDGEGRPLVVSGVPPDYFSATGQRWGNPLYRWERMRANGFRWWTQRFRRTLELVDVVRIDHFRGFEAYWEIPGDEETALHGRWRPGPGTELFDAVRRELGQLPLVAEDLGLITPEVEALRDRLGLPGMRVLQFAFGGDDPESPHLPGNYPEGSVAYTGTHDNDTALGWLRGAGAEERERVERLLAPGEDPGWGMIRLVMESRAKLAVVPLQDVLALGSEGRMNTPGTGAGNWAWRFREGALTGELARRLRELARATGRAPSPPAALPS